MSIRDLVHGRNKQNKEYTKRDVVIVDRTGQITVTLWYQMVMIERARQISLSPRSTLLGRNVSHVSDSNGDHVQRRLCQ